MKVYILEDDLIQQFRLENLVRRYSEQQNYPFDDIVVCGRTQDLVAALKGVFQNNIYFLDIGIQGNQNAGLEMAEEIRKMDPIGQISFVTMYSEFAPITYEYRVNAHDFIDKTLMPDEFERRIKENINHFIEVNRLKPLNDIFSYKTRTGKTVEVLYSDIYYFETTGLAHKLLLQMDSETMTIYGVMNDIENMSERLIRVHRSYLVNKERIKRIYKKEKLILLDDDTEIPVSRAGFKILEQLDLKGRAGCRRRHSIAGCKQLGF
jgi:two-component system response regulator AgrA